MTLELAQDSDAMKLDTRLLKSGNFYHFRDLIAIPKMNDLIFRRRLFHTSWQKRKQALNHILDFLRVGGRFSGTLLEEDLSVHRDYHLLFGPKEHLIRLLHEEAKWLPLNQTHSLHDKYALAAQLCRSESPQEELTKTIELLNQKTPKVGADWQFWHLLNDDDLRHGPVFLAPNERSAAAFCKDVNAAVTSDTIAEKNVGLCAFGFLEADPALMTPKTISQERRLVTEIVTILKANEVKSAAPCTEYADDLTDDRWKTDPLPSVEAGL